MEKFRRYVLISIYNWNDEIDPNWIVHGHKNMYASHIIKEDFVTKNQALEYAHQLPWKVPVIIGQGEEIRAIAEKLSSRLPGI